MAYHYLGCVFLSLFYPNKTVFIEKCSILSGAQVFKKPKKGEIFAEVCDGSDGKVEVCSLQNTRW